MNLQGCLKKLSLKLCQKLIFRVIIPCIPWRRKLCLYWKVYYNYTLCTVPNLKLCPNLSHLALKFANQIYCAGFSSGISQSCKHYNIFLLHHMFLSSLPLALVFALTCHRVREFAIIPENTSFDDTLKGNTYVSASRPYDKPPHSKPLSGSQNTGSSCPSQSQEIHKACIFCHPFTYIYIYVHLHCFLSTQVLFSGCQVIFPSCCWADMKLQRGAWTAL